MNEHSLWWHMKRTRPCCCFVHWSPLLLIPAPTSLNRRSPVVLCANAEKTCVFPPTDKAALVSSCLMTSAMTSVRVKACTQRGDGQRPAHRLGPPPSVLFDHLFLRPRYNSNQLSGCFADLLLGTSPRPHGRTWCRNKTKRGGDGPLHAAGS